MVSPGDRTAHRTAAAGHLAGGALVLVSGFLPWFTPVDSSYDTSRSGWSGSLAPLAFVLGVGLALAAALPLAAGRVPPLGRAVRRSGVPVLSAGVSVLVAGAACMIVLVVWLLGASFADPVLPGPGLAAGTGSTASWPGAGPALSGAAAAGLHTALAGTVIELIGAGWVLWRSGPSTPVVLRAP